MKNAKLFLIASLALVAACGQKSEYRDPNKDVLIKNEKRVEVVNGVVQDVSTSAGNLMATALKEANDLDIVLYPGNLANRNLITFLPTNAFEMDRLLELYPEGNMDQFRIGVMSGRNIRRLIEDRSREIYGKELDVAGLRYQIHYIGGIQQYSEFEKEETRQPLDEEKKYRVAISEYFWFSGPTFPSYKYRNSISTWFGEVKFGVSARESLRKYLSGKPSLPYLEERRAIVSRSLREGGTSAGFMPIRQIQASQHQTPYYGRPVTTRGIVTAAGTVQWYPGGYDLYIQDSESDNDDTTSEAIAVHFDSEDLSKYLPNTEGEENYEPIRLGDLIEVTGVVYDQIMNEGLGKTVIREIRGVKRLSRDNILPEAVEIGEGTSRPIPQKYVSTYRGNLNLKPNLNLNDGIDFWRSLQGMRVKIHNPRVVGFRGGVESFADDSPKGYLTLYVVPDGDRPMGCDTIAGGCIIDDAKKIYNPHILPIVSNHLSRPIETAIYFKVSPDPIGPEVEGVVGYETNIFGGGEYSLVIPRVPAALKRQTRSEFQCDPKLKLKADPKLTDDFDCFMKAQAKFKGKEFDLDLRGKTKLVSDDDSLTVATYNVQNLSDEDRRIQKLGESIVTNLKCPDILNLVEIQDNNGPDLTGSSSALGTLQAITESINANAETRISKLQKALTEETNADNKKRSEQKIAEYQSDIDQARRCAQTEYEILNIDPTLHAEGGQPGGNIRVAMLYNKRKLDFSPRGSSGPFDEAVVLSSGDLNNNPGRVHPNDEVFNGSRRSLVAQFSYRGEKIFVIGNHFNSKLGDASLWGAQQPAIFGSEPHRTKIASRVSSFVGEIVRQAPDAHVIVLGDFNANIDESAMQVLAGENLKNLVSYGNLIPVNERYSITYNGNSEPLDYIFVNKSLLQKKPRIEIIHMNTNFMGRIADHDPVVSKFYFR